jgi:uncharacterized membrane protein YeaQ/YmgE (transglycosylase-associated protein family)
VRIATVGIIAWIIIGLIAGWLANQILGGRGGGLLYNLAVGLVGAIVGGVVFRAINIVPEANFIGQLISATVGAIILLAVWRAIKKA